MPVTRTAVLIDLGEDWEMPDALDEPPRRDWHRAMLMVALIAVLATAGAAPAHNSLREVTALAGEGTHAFAVSGNALHVVAPSGNQSSVSSYALANGRLRWQANVTGLVTRLLPSAGVLLAIGSTIRGLTVLPDSVGALDEATGRVLWSSPNSELVDVRPDVGVAVLVRNQAPHAGQVFAIDLRGGAIRWSVQPDATEWALVAAAQDQAEVVGPARVALLVDQNATVLDEATGAVVATRTVPIPPAEQRADIDLPRLSIVDNQVIVAYEDHFKTVLSGFGLGLQPHWQIIMPSQTSFVAACGPVICVGTGVLATCAPVRCSAIDSALFGLDPATAHIRWMSRLWSRTNGLLTGARLLAVNREPPGSLLSEDGVIDADSGALVIQLAQWMPVDAAPAGTAGSAGSAGTAGRFGPVLVATHSGPYHSWFAWLDPYAAEGEPALAPLGLLAVSGEDCQSTVRYLVCPTLARELAIWRIDG
jgi:hypothetical protein